MLLQILIMLFIFLLVGITGFIVLRTITKEQNLLILISAGILFGLCIYIFLLNLNSKFLAGPSGILLSTTELLALSLYLHTNYKKNWTDIKIAKQRIFLGGALLALAIILIYIRVTTLFPAADSTMQWAYAGAFARGNHPLMMPWQPDLPPNYHLGAYFFEGALQLFSGLSYTLIHTLVNIYFIVPLILLSLLLLWEKKNKIKNIWLVSATLVLFLSFGVIAVMYPNFTTSDKTTVSLFDANKILPSIPAKGEGGAPLVSLHILTLLPARSLALGFVLLVLFFTRLSFVNNKLKILSLVMIFSVTALVEESVFLPMLLTFISVLIFSFLSFIPKLGYLQKYRRTFFITVILTLMLITVQGGFITDNLFTRKESAYHIILPFLNSAFSANTTIFQSINLSSISFLKNINIFIPNPLLIMASLLIFSFFKREPITGLVGLFSAISFILYSTIEYIYCPSCSSRIYSLGNIAAGYGLVLLIFFAFKNLSTKKNLLVFLILLPVLIFPTLFPDFIAQVKSIREGIHDKKANVIFSQNLDLQNLMAKWANRNLPINSRIIVLDREYPSPSGSLSFQYQGLYTIYGPQFIRSNRQEPGIEYFDLSLTLNPSLFKQTRTEYLYIESTSLAYKQLPKFRKDDLKNSKYFQVLKSNELIDGQGNRIFFRIYKVQPMYLDPTLGGKEINDTTLSALKDLVPDDKSIFISDYGENKLNFWFRMALVLALKDKDIRRHLTQTEYQVIEIFFPRKESEPNEIYDYYILTPKEKPPVDAESIWSNNFSTAWKRI